MHTGESRPHEYTWEVMETRKQCRNRGPLVGRVSDIARRKATYMACCEIWQMDSCADGSVLWAAEETEQLSVSAQSWGFVSGRLSLHFILKVLCSLAYWSSYKFQLLIEIKNETHQLMVVLSWQQCEGIEWATTQFHDDWWFLLNLWH